jgi:hypothetical protein
MSEPAPAAVAAMEEAAATVSDAEEVLWSARVSLPRGALVLARLSAAFVGTPLRLRLRSLAEPRLVYASPAGAADAMAGQLLAARCQAGEYELQLCTLAATARRET